MRTRINSISVGRQARGWRQPLTAVLIVSASGGALGQVRHYSIDDVGALGGPMSTAFALNDFGMVAGSSAKADANIHGYLWDGSLLEIAPLPGDTQSHGFAMSSDGETAVMSYLPGGLNVRGLLWDAGVVTDLGAFAPRGMNDNRVVAGFISLDEPGFGRADHAALWIGGGVIDLLTLGGHFSYAYAVSPTLQIVGQSFTTNDAAFRATLWQGGQVRDLGTLGGANSHAYDIDGFGRVVGVADRADGKPHAFLFTIDAGGNVTARFDLGELGGGQSCAYGVNDGGDVVGTSDGRAFHWHSGLLTDLNAVLWPGADWQLGAAWAVNNAGQISGTGAHHGQRRGFVLTPREQGDLNCDGEIDAFDIEPFVLALFDPAGYELQHPNCNIMLADVNDDGHVDAFDIEPFIDLLFGP